MRYFEIELMVSCETYCFFTFASDHAEALKMCLSHIESERINIKTAAEKGFLNIEIKERK